MEIKEIPFETTWDLRHRVMWPDKPIEYVMLPEDKNGLHYGLFKNQQLIAIVSVFIKDKDAQFRKFATLDSEQGRGYGTKLLSHLFQELTKMEITRIWCNARTDKTSFYDRFGMTKTDRIYEKGGINFVIMEKNV